MCGIIGWYNKLCQVDLNKFNLARDTMAHRGPDGQGTTQLLDGHLAIGHRRLSIIDLSQTGAQPMCNPDKSIWITFNGEIYNYKKLRRELQAEGYQFFSNTDTEVILQGYSAWGIQTLLKKLKGMFAFAIFDAKKKLIFSARDRFGMKPFIYMCDENNFIFASEIKAISALHKESFDVNYESQADYFLYGYVPSPKSIYKGLYKLPPANYLTYDLKNGKIKIQKYWDLAEVNESDISKKEFFEAFHDKLNISVSQHFESDVPVGIFLSGGYDSSNLLRISRDIGFTPECFSIDVKGYELNEYEQAAEIASIFGVKQYTLLLNPEDNNRALVDSCYDFLDEPFSISSTLNTFHLSKFAAQSTKVVFTGEGADELMAGYKWHFRLDDYFRVGSYIRKIKDIIKYKAFSFKDLYLAQYNRSMTGTWNNLKNKNVLDPDFEHFISKRRLLHFEQFMDAKFDYFKQGQYLDVNSFVPDHCLHRSDMMGMAHSLEIRVPYLDHELFELIFSVPSEYYTQPRIKKPLIHNQLKTYLPESIMNLRKRGFNFKGVFNLTDGEYLNKNDLDLLLLNKLIHPSKNVFGNISEDSKFSLLNMAAWLKKNS